MGKLVSEGLAGPRSAPSPKPAPGPTPSAQAEITEEIRKLPERVKKLEEQGVAVFGYLGDLRVKLEEYHRQVSQVLSMVGGISVPPMPKIPSPPFSVRSRKAARGKAGEKREKAPGRKSGRKVRKRG